MSKPISELQKEFSPEEDPYQSARKKGASRWIIAHLFHGTNKLIIVIVIFSTVLSANLASANMVIIGQAISEFLNGNGSNLIYYLIIILLLGLGGPLVRLINFMLREILAQRMERDTRKEFYSSLLGKSQSFHDRQETGELMARATDDVRNLNFLVSPALSLILESFTSLIIPAIYVLLFYPTQLIITPISFSILFLIFLWDYNKRIGPVTRDLRSQYGKMNSVLNEALSGIETIKATAQEKTEALKYYLQAKEYRNFYVERGKVQAKYLPILLYALSVTIGLGHAIFLYTNGLMGIGEIIGYVGLLTQLRFPTNISIFVFGIIRLATAGAERLLELMNQKTEIDENISGISQSIDGEIEFKNVTFIYPGGDKPVLNDISFKIEAGKTAAIVGTTGSGKTTLTKLISRLYDINEGKILIDGIDIKDYSLKSLRSQISYIEQDLFLFSDTIIENITFGRTSSIEDVKRVAKEAQAHDFISNFPDQYETEVGERGVTLSGGEKQRVAIARAFLTDPRILILDDSTSAIDSETEDKIQRAIKNILRNRTTLLITHRLSQIRWADLIIVLKRGKIAAKGTHEELLLTSQEYRKIFVKKFDTQAEKILEKVK
ncbi:MAG: ATP-binding cassette domain-containing protein [Candidatus Lokiarchaeota archaeon]|nr:ATP-binding cassette domain-containing protein [Candidatus Lokiarchaeota archaeon]MBD3202544.1 ATP-binding cassette domain-containing protein [Candidatus Lokiarchaeota archaeon]